MHNSFIDKYSCTVLLGPMSKNFTKHENIATWLVGKKWHFVAYNDLNQNDINILSGIASEFNFHYMTDSNLAFLKNHFKVDRGKGNSTCIDLTKLSYVGKKYRDIRNYINRNEKLGFEVLDNYKDINDVKVMIEEWSDVLCQKYFRDMSGKNVFFLKNNFHKDCLNTFVYDSKGLISFACLSPGTNSSYIIGKALCNRYPGLSEYTDNLSYQKAIVNGTLMVNLGQSKGHLADYKNKFPGSYMIQHFDGEISVL